MGSASCGCLRNGHNRSNVGGITENSLVSGRIRTGDPVNSNYCAPYGNHKSNPAISTASQRDIFRLLLYSMWQLQ